MNIIDDFDYYALTDEETYAIENGEEINEGTYEFFTDAEIAERLSFEMYILLEGGIGYNQYLATQCENAVKDLKSLDKKKIKNLNSDSIKNIIELLLMHKDYLEDLILRNRDKYRLLQTELKTNYGHIELH